MGIHYTDEFKNIIIKEYLEGNNAGSKILSKKYDISYRTIATLGLKNIKDKEIWIMIYIIQEKEEKNQKLIIKKDMKYLKIPNSVKIDFGHESVEIVK